MASVFTTEGQFVTSLGREGEGPGEFKIPVYVCDCDNNRVQVF